MISEDRFEEVVTDVAIAITDGVDAHEKPADVVDGEEFGVVLAALCKATAALIQTMVHNGRPVANPDGGASVFLECAVAEIYRYREEMEAEYQAGKKSHLKVVK